MGDKNVRPSGFACTQLLIDIIAKLSDTPENLTSFGSMKFTTLCLTLVISWIYTGSAQPPAAPKTGEKLDPVNAAHEAYQKDIQTAERNFRTALSKALNEAATVEIYLLDFETKEVEHARENYEWYSRLEEDQFPIIPYHASSKILKRKKLTAEEIKLLLPSLQAVVGVEKSNGGAGCHFPIHGIRISSESETIFQSSFCYHCSNFYILYPSDVASWTSLSSKEFQKVMEQLMPIPQAEKDRFDKKWGKKAEKKK